MNLEFMTRSNLRPLADGGCAYFPWGALGRGYVLPGPEARVRIHRVTVATTFALLLVGPIAGGLLGLPALFVVIGTGVAAFLIWQFNVVRRLPVAPMRLTVREVVADNRWVAYALCFPAAVFAALAVLYVVARVPNAHGAVAGLVVGALAMALEGIFVLWWTRGIPPRPPAAFYDDGPVKPSSS